MTDVKVTRINLTGSEALNWLVLEGSVDGVPAVSKRVSIALSALVIDPSLQSVARANLIAEVTAMHANYLVLQGIE